MVFNPSTFLVASSSSSACREGISPKDINSTEVSTNIWLLDK